VPDFTLEPQNTLVPGMTGSGKTTFVIRLLLNSAPACRFIFDDENRTAPRLRLNPCYTERDLEDALATRWVAFNPCKLFFPRPGDRDILAPKKRAFAYFCAWIFHVAGRGPGVKIISLPEIWRFCTPDAIPPEFASLMQMGRELNTHVIMDTQRPEMVNPSIIGSATELVCFKLLSPEALRTVDKLGADREKVAALPLGSFASYNRLTGGTLAGKLF
jgi:hypothetical protein